MNPEQSMQVIIDYLWEYEKQHFEQEYNVRVTGDLAPWIKWCEIRGRGMLKPTDHMFYHLMVLKHTYTIHKNKRRN